MPVRLTATALTAPAVAPTSMGRIDWFPQPPHTRMLVWAEEIEGVAYPLSVSGYVSVLVREPVSDLAPGQRVELFGIMQRPAGPRNPGERDWALAARRNRILVNLSCEHAANLVPLPARSTPRGWLFHVRRYAVAAMRHGAFDEDVPGLRLLSALVLGQRSAVGIDLNQAFVNTGTVHYLSVSGAHVAMLAGAVWGLGILAGLTKRGCAAVAALVVTAYAVMTEPSPAVWRSAIMGLLLCAAILLRRPVRTANWLAASAIVLLILQPTHLFDPGFQLSFVTLISLIYLGPQLRHLGAAGYWKLTGRDDPLLQPRIQDLLNPPTRLKRIGRWCAHACGAALAVGLAAWMPGVLLGAWHFHQAAPWGWANTLLVMPLMWMVLVLGLAKTILTMLLPPAGALLGRVLAWLTDGLIWFVRLLDHLPGSGVATPAVPAWLLASGLALLAFWIAVPWLRVGRRYVVGISACWFLAGLWAMGPRSADGQLRVHVLSVGDGTACVICLPDGRTLLYDLGSRPPYDIYRWTLSPVLASENVYGIDALIMSHPQLDHFSGVPDLLDRVPIKRIITTPHFRQQAAGPASRLVERLESCPVAWQTAVRGDRVAGSGSVAIDVLWPPAPQKLEIQDENAASLVLRLDYAGHRILLCGDIEEFALRALLASGEDLKAEVLVLPHHGAVDFSTRRFIDAVHPLWCVRSSGQRDRETSNGLLRIMVGRRYLNTAECGGVTLDMGQKGLLVRTSRDQNQ
ncbi:MAG: competence protein ComEC [Phycisphaerae bacterium]